MKEDEVDLRELFKTIWDKKVFIVVFTLFITILAVIYAYSKTPIYEVKSVVRIGHIQNELVEPTNIIVKKLRLIFNLEGNKEAITEDNGIVTNINTSKGVDNFIEIVTQGFSNELALKKNKEVIGFLKDEYKYKIDEFIFKTNQNIKKLEENIDYIETVEKTDIENEIKKVKEQNIPEIEDQIKFIKNAEIKSVENKLAFNEKKLKEYEKNLSKISNTKSSNDTQNMLMAMQTLNTQNLILNLQNQIENLIKEKANLQDIVLKNLESKKENQIKENIRKLKLKLDFTLKNKIKDIKNKIVIEKLKLTNNSIKNTELVGQFIKKESPIKPKKKLIVVVSFITALILSIFIVFFMQFFRNMKEEN